MEAVATKKYFVVAPNGQEYGPADVKTLHNWAKEGRLKENTTLREDGGGKMSAYFVPGIFLAAAPPVVEERDELHDRALAQSMVMQPASAAPPAIGWSQPPVKPSVTQPAGPMPLQLSDFFELRVQKMDNRVLVPHAAAIAILMFAIPRGIPFVSFGLFVYLFVFGIYCLFFRRNGSAYLAATLSLGVVGIMLFLAVSYAANMHFAR